MPTFGGGAWWALAAGPGLPAGGWRWWLGRQEADLRNPAGRRRRAALATARGHLKSVATTGDNADGLALVSRAVTGYVADCLDIPATAVGNAELAELAERRRFPAAGSALASLLERCDQARFGGRSGAAAADLAAEALESLVALERADQPARAGRGTAGALALLLTAVLAAAAAPAAAADAKQLVAQGNQAYTDGRFTEARDLYLQARALGLDAAALHYNLGNAQARAGEVGSAMASYLRAQRLSPRDRDMRSNLAWMRRNLKDLELANQSLPLFIAQAAAVVGALSLDEWGILLVVALWLTAIVLGWGWARGASRLQRRSLVVVVSATVLVAAVATGRWQQERVRDQAVVVAGAVAVRSGPAATFPTLFEVHAGLALNVEEQRDGWERVSLGGDWQGWLPAEAVEHVRLPAAGSRRGSGPGPVDSRGARRFAHGHVDQLRQLHTQASEQPHGQDLRRRVLEPRHVVQAVVVQFPDHGIDGAADLAVIHDPAEARVQFALQAHDHARRCGRAGAGTCGLRAPPAANGRRRR